MKVIENKIPAIVRVQTEDLEVTIRQFGTSSKQVFVLTYFYSC